MLPKLVAAVLLVLTFANSIEALSWTYLFRSYEPKICFNINVQDETQKITIYFNLHEGTAAQQGHMLDYVLSGPNGQQLHTEKKTSTNDFTVVPTMAGEHNLCFTHHGSPSEKTIDLDVTLSKSTKPPATSGTPGSTELQTSSPTAELERINQRVSEDLRALHHSLLGIKDREKRNSYTVKSIRGLIKWFSILQCLTVIAMGFAHVYVLKTFFSNNARARV